MRSTNCFALQKQCLEIRESRLTDKEITLLSIMLKSFWSSEHILTSKGKYQKEIISQKHLQAFPPYHRPLPMSPEVPKKRLIEGQLKA